jgi:hypothetical protein
VVENAIQGIKVFLILREVFCHYQNEKGLIKEDNIFTICISLVNQKIKKTPLLSHDRTTFDWHKVFKLLLPLSPNLDENMTSDVEA